MSRHPSTNWAQLSDTVFITIELPDAKDVKLNLQPDGHFSFSAKSGADNVPYELDLELFDKVKVNESKAAVTSRHICYLVAKEKKKWWPRLLKQAGRTPVYIKVDWNKWVDEDEEKDNKIGSDMDFSGMDFSNLGMGGPDDMVDDDDDEDEDDDDESVESAPTEKIEETSGSGEESKVEAKA
ncbi:co-chaperone protein p23-1-like isoform X1 [Carex rostrata]